MINLVDKTIKYCKNMEIDYNSIILHGSRAQGFASDNSDYDLLIVVNEEAELKNKIDVFVDDEGNKIQLEFINLLNFEKMLTCYENELFSKIFDLNILAGRVFMGKIIYSSDNKVSELIKVNMPYKNKKKLMDKFSYQAINFYSDSKTDDLILKQYSISRMIESIGVVYLISKDISWLNLKWQHRFIEKFMDECNYNDYLQLKFFSNNLSDKEVKLKATQLLNIL